ncbi:MAG TPA: Rieske 2Fe-2S domain-containing protein [Chloroflexota bacterium]
MLTREENELLVRVGPGTPMGEMMRRYWVPACLSEELPIPDSDPLRVRLLGEDLIAFRDSAGRVGLMDQHCPHRRAGLFLARNEEGGLRCLYHGWKIDVEGNILETPCEPAGSNFKDKVKAKAYPVHEAGGVVWTYMGPREHQTPFPNYEWTLCPLQNISIAKTLVEANYLQPVEGNADSSHADVLHRGLETIILRNPDKPIDIEAKLHQHDTPYGIMTGAIREDKDDPEHVNYVNSTHFVFPFYWVVPPRGHSHVHLYVPIDDEHTWDYSDYYHRTLPINHEAMLRRRRVMPGVDLLPDRRRKRNIGNGLLQDRQAMREKRSFTGIGDNPHEDEGIQESMGPICDRWNEHLAGSDASVIHLRRRLLEVVHAFMEGEAPPGTQPEYPYEQIISHRKLVPKDVPWYEIGDYPAEDLIPDYAAEVAG